jgi:hypothetical protein
MLSGTTGSVELALRVDPSDLVRNSLITLGHAKNATEAGWRLFILRQCHRRAIVVRPKA